VAEKTSPALVPYEELTVNQRKRGDLFVLAVRMLLEAVGSSEEKS
jgi:hypothetical protein